ncbi:crooked neck-like protein 1-like [Pyrus ussuriensis x Pyrus communis]|uniref:Crooked neck-like protein 1-like n=1 Tax=Pyrus ussuriensis x Pyrus communis TaxID=2448454 RepID=A0A5N5HJT3_9ROSA|nr:crooked neck-like protein 1-like [Pyrus ussuriensis x Pyrus communis]
MVQRRPEEAGNWIRYANFEMKNGDVARARNVFERAVKKVPLADDEEEDDGAGQLFEAFAEFEQWCKDAEDAL